MPAPETPSRVHAVTDDALGHLDAVGVVEAIASGAVGATEVVEAAIARTEAVDPVLGAVAWRAWERARAEAAAPRGGFFSGVPTFVKDNVDVAGMPTLHGTDAFVGRPAARDGDLTRMYLATGLVALGKTRLSELGMNAAAEHPRLGPVRNPWGTGHTAGASSAGSAALVAAGAVPIAHANDGGGSIRIPASVTGLVGLKPTRGRLAQDALLRRMPVRIVSDGVLTRSVRDTAAFLREAEKVYRDLSLPPVCDITRPGRQRLRIGFTTSGAGRSASLEVVEQTLRTAALLEELGHHVEEVAAPAPASFPDDFLLYWGSLAAASVVGGRSQHGRTFDRTRLDELTHGLADHVRRHLPRLPGAVARLRRTAGVSARFHERHDVLLSPTLATATPPVGHLAPGLGYGCVIERLQEWVAFTPWQNATGDPAVSLPLARTADDLPLGMMLSAGHGREALLLELSLELEQARPFTHLGRSEPV
ncbi:amidase [Nocardioides marinisabuli]|uniref:Amidase n=1 Tax=Nocardioides marinisabuli TaxID=419476 RepID=A0A7Y9EZ22_9ACTN|nr:amidase [Nocardioides marinisabuli]NYD56509.1 amidase [Nocardioides marinisabuli]